jgi:hypothetical protein
MLQRKDVLKYYTPTAGQDIPSLYGTRRLIIAITKAANRPYTEHNESSPQTPVLSRNRKV